jgi:hypothetical protein
MDGRVAAGASKKTLRQSRNRPGPKTDQNVMMMRDE